MSSIKIPLSSTEIQKKFKTRVKHTEVARPTLRSSLEGKAEDLCGPTINNTKLFEGYDEA